MPAIFNYFLLLQDSGILASTSNTTTISSVNSNRGDANIFLSWVFLVPMLLLLILLLSLKHIISRNGWPRWLRSISTSQIQNTGNKPHNHQTYTEEDLEYAGISDEEEAVTAAREQFPWNHNVYRSKESYSSTFAAWMTPTPKSEKNYSHQRDDVHSSNERGSQNNSLTKMEALSTPPVRFSLPVCEYFHFCLLVIVNFLPHTYR